MKKIILIIWFLLLNTCALYSQESETIDPDKIYLEALEAFRNGEFEKTILLTGKGLNVAPQYHDIRILMIKALWAQEFPTEADEELNKLLIMAPMYPDVLPLVHQRFNKFELEQEQLNYVEQMEEIFPDDTFLQIQKADLYIKNNRKAEGRELAFKLLSKQKISGAERYNLQNILARSTSNEVAVGYQYIGFSSDYPLNDYWQNLTAEYLHNFNQTSVTGRINYADRGYEQAYFYEIEAYPVFTDRFYAFVNVGISQGKLFPEFRTSLSLYYNFLKIFEAEAGGRLQKFQANSHFTGVAGLSLYQGNFLFNTRTFIGPERNGQLDLNYQVSVRYYFHSEDDYLFIRLGSGITPDDQLLATQQLSHPGLKANIGMVGVNFSVGIHHLFQISAGLLREDINKDVKGSQYLGNVNYRFRF